MEKRKYYIDNLRWACILMLVPFHCAMAWNSWGEGNYIWFHEHKGISTFIVMISPWYMSLLFVIAGMSARYAMQKRSYRQFVKERKTKLLIPLIVCILTVIPLMTYYADRFHNEYNYSFISHYKVFFTRFTTLTGYDGGFTPAHLWFLLYLFLISIMCIGIIAMQKKFYPNFKCISINMASIMVIGVLPIVMNPIINLAGKSIGSYFILYLMGYYIISENDVLDKISKYRFVNLVIMLVASVGNAYIFLWLNGRMVILNTILNYVASWFGILTMLGFGKRYFNRTNSLTRYLSSRSFLFYIFHFIWVILFQYYLSKYTNSTWMLFLIPIMGSYLMTFFATELVIRTPVINVLFGSKGISNKKQNYK